MNVEPLVPGLSNPPPNLPPILPRRPLLVASSALLTPSLLIIIVWGMISARPFLVPVFISALLAFSLAPGLHFLRRHRVPEGAALFLSGLTLVLPIPTLGYGLVRQIQSLTRDLPSILDSLSHWVRRTGAELSASDLGQRFNLGPTFSKSLSFSSDNLGQRLSELFGHGFQFAIAGIGAAISATSAIALVLFFTLLMLVFRQHIRVSTEKILGRAGAPALLDAITSLIERFLLARLAIVLIVAAIDIAVLGFFRISYNLLIGSFLGVMTLIPAVGFILGVIPPVIVSLATGHSGLSTLSMIGVLFAVSFFEGNILTPKLIGHHLNINALTIFFGIFGGGLIWGISGMLLSVPFLGVLRIILSTVPITRPWGELLADRKESRIERNISRTRKY